MTPHGGDRDPTWSPTAVSRAQVQPDDLDADGVLAPAAPNDRDGGVTLHGGDRDATWSSTTVSRAQVQPDDLDADGVLAPVDPNDRDGGVR